MTGKPQLEIKIAPHGAVEIEAINCTGEQCVVASEPIEIVLGGVTKRQDKPERYAPAANSTLENLKQSF